MSDKEKLENMFDLKKKSYQSNAGNTGNFAVHSNEKV